MPRQTIYANEPCCKAAVAGDDPPRSVEALPHVASASKGPKPKLDQPRIDDTWGQP